MIILSSSLGDAFNKVWNDLINFWFKGSDTESPFIGNFCLALITLIVGYFLIKIILMILKKIFKIDKKIIKEQTVKSFILNTIKVLMYCLLFFLILAILKVDLTGAATIFSSAILAIGLSLQDVISNFASGIIILSNKPFVNGDYVNIGNGQAEGVIKDVKFLVTRLETYDRQIVTIPNKTITSEVITNYTKHSIRRIVINMELDIDADTKLAREIMLKIANSDNRVLIDPAPNVVILGLKDRKIQISVRCFSPTNLYWDVMFDITEKIIDEFKRLAIKLPVNYLKIEENSVLKN